MEGGTRQCQRALCPTKKIRGDKSAGVKIHRNMEISQGSSLCTHLYLKLTCHVFCFIFSLIKSEDRRAEQVLPRGEDWYQWEGR
jgi:hypothetical protein